MYREAVLIKEEEGSFTPFRSIWQIDANETDVYQCRAQLQKGRICKYYTSFYSGRAAIHRIMDTNQVPDLILLELYLPGKGGLDFLQRFQEVMPPMSPQPKIVVLTSWLNYRPLLVKNAFEFPQVIACVEKPLNTSILLDTVLQIPDTPEAIHY
jgi:CheY-like chemotaxis protein